MAILEFLNEFYLQKGDSWDIVEIPTITRTLLIVVLNLNVTNRSLASKIFDS
jgi:hypothetical protein